MREGSPIAVFRHALFVLATVMSAPRPGIAVLDAGLKALAMDSGLPLVWQHADWRYTGASDEHGKLEYALGGPRRRNSAKSTAWSPATATRRSTATTGMSASGRAAWNVCGQSPAAAQPP